METQAVDYLVKEFSEILGKITTTPMQDLLMLDAVNRAKKMEEEGKQDLLEALLIVEKQSGVIWDSKKGKDFQVGSMLHIIREAINKAKGE